MKVAIIGTRTFSNYTLLESKVLEILSGGVQSMCTEIVSGGAPGTDQLAAQFATAHTIPIKIFPADWATFGKSAGPRRNKEIVDYADIIIAFWDGQSPGTRNTIQLARTSGKPVTIVSI